MSCELGKVLSLILKERFGPVIEKIALYLFQYGSNPLLYVKKGTDLPLSKVKEALAVLIKYSLVSFKPNKNENLANYTLNNENVLLMLRYPKYINIIKKQFGDEAEIMIEEILQRGYWTASEVLLKVNERKNDQSVSLSQIKEKFISLVNAKYLIRAPYPEDTEKPVPELTMPEEATEGQVTPQIDLVEINMALKNNSNKNLSDKNVYWTVNFDRFHQDMRDNILITAFTRKFDENAGNIVKFMLQQMYIRTEPWAEVSNPIPLLSVKEMVRRQVSGNKMMQLISYFDQYINVLEQDGSSIINKSGEAGGGSVSIYLKEAFTQFAWEVIEQCVLEKFDSKAARIFRLVRLKEYIESDLIQKLAMIPAKEAKKLSYQLLEENFLQITEIRKATSSGGPNKSFMLFHIQLERVVRMVLELCYKTLFNVMTRRNHEKVTNKRIIDKKHRVETIAMGMRAQGATEEQLQDIEELITPPENEILEKIDKMMKKLNAVELEVDDTIFLLQMFLVYH